MSRNRAGSLSGMDYHRGMLSEDDSKRNEVVWSEYTVQRNCDLAELGLTHSQIRSFFFPQEPPRRFELSGTASGLCNVSTTPTGISENRKISI